MCYDRTQEVTIVAAQCISSERHLHASSLAHPIVVRGAL